MKMNIDFQNKDDLLILLDVFDQHSRELKGPNETVFKVLGETNFIQALAHLNYHFNGVEDESNKI